MCLIRIISPILILALALLASSINAAEPANFYQGKTIRIIVGLAAGGGYDLYARTLARHMGKHIPGNPAVVVENMTGAGSDDIPKILAATINLPAQVVAGYKGTAETRLAFNNGEVQATSNAWESTKSTWCNELESGTLKVVLQATLKSHPELKQIPVAYDLAKTNEARQLLATVLRANSPTVRPFMAPPGTPDDRVQILRKAFMDTWKDPELIAEAKKANLDINPDDGAGLEANIKEMFKLEPAQIAKLRDILK